MKKGAFEEDVEDVTETKDKRVKCLFCSALTTAGDLACDECVRKGRIIHVSRYKKHALSVGLVAFPLDSERIAMGWLWALEKERRVRNGR